MIVTFEEATVMDQLQALGRGDGARRWLSDGAHLAARQHDPFAALDPGVGHDAAEAEAEEGRLPRLARSGVGASAVAI